MIFVFENDKALSQFLDSGWSGSAQTNAAAKAGEKGLLGSGRGCPGAMGVPDYQEWSWPSADPIGHKYYKDDDFNKPSSGE